MKIIEIIIMVFVYGLALIWIGAFVYLTGIFIKEKLNKNNAQEKNKN